MDEGNVVRKACPHNTAHALCSLRKLSQMHESPQQLRQEWAFAAALSIDGCSIIIPSPFCPSYVAID